MNPTLDWIVRGRIFSGTLNGVSAKRGTARLHPYHGAGAPAWNGVYVCFSDFEGFQTPDFAGSVVHGPGSGLCQPDYAPWGDFFTRF
jgi:hypothetical protein